MGVVLRIPEHPVQGPDGQRRCGKGARREQRHETPLDGPLARVRGHASGLGHGRVEQVRADGDVQGKTEQQ